MQVPVIENQKQRTHYKGNTEIRQSRCSPDSRVCTDLLPENQFPFAVGNEKEEDEAHTEVNGNSVFLLFTSVNIL